ncbi:unnamed protein product, partial [Polarella glacialis]
MSVEGWCTGVCICREVWWCGPQNFLRAAALSSGFWVCIYHAFAFGLFPLVEQRLRRHPSKFPEEESCHWFASHAQSSLHALCAVYMALQPAW